jgi:hypothetical protein
MKKKLLKSTAISLALCFSLSTIAFADETTPETNEAIEISTQATADEAIEETDGEAEEINGETAVSDDEADFAEDNGKNDISESTPPRKFVRRK